MANSIPEGWKSVALSKLLTSQQIKDVLLIVNENHDGHTRTQKLRAYFGGISKELEAKGVLPAFLAYSIEHYVQQNK